jgi:hypothetical protein
MAFKTENYNLPLVDSKMIANGPQAINSLAQSIDEQFVKTERMVTDAIDSIIVPAYELPVATSSVLGGIMANRSGERTNVSNVYMNKDYKLFVPLATTDDDKMYVPKSANSGSVVVSEKVDELCPLVVDNDINHGIAYVNHSDKGGAITEPNEGSALVIDGTTLKVEDVAEDNLSTPLKAKLYDPYSIGVDYEEIGKAFHYLREVYALVGMNYLDDKYAPVETEAGKISVVKFLPGVFSFQVNVSFALSPESTDYEATLFECVSDTHALELASILNDYFVTFAKDADGKYSHVQTSLIQKNNFVYVKLTDYSSDYSEVIVIGSAVITM